MLGERFQVWTRRRLAQASGGVLLTLLARGAEPARAKTRAQSSPPQTWQLTAEGGSGVGGTVTLQRRKRGTAITVDATGLQAGTTYVSLVYENTTCAVEAYSGKDYIGQPYQADSDGNGHTQGKVRDKLSHIGSVSVRHGQTFVLLACASNPAG
jgi:Cu/Zn superoxide dismutase